MTEFKEKFMKGMRDHHAPDIEQKRPNHYKEGGSVDHDDDQREHHFWGALAGALAPMAIPLLQNVIGSAFGGGRQAPQQRYSSQRGGWKKGGTVDDDTHDSWENHFPGARESSPKHHSRRHHYHEEECPEKNFKRPAKEAVGITISIGGPSLAEKKARGGLLNMTQYGPYRPGMNLEKKARGGLLGARERKWMGGPLGMTWKGHGPAINPRIGRGLAGIGPMISKGPTADDLELIKSRLLSKSRTGQIFNVQGNQSNPNVGKFRAGGVAKKRKHRAYGGDTYYPTPFAPQKNS